VNAPLYVLGRIESTKRRKIGERRKKKAKEETLPSPLNPTNQP
jgi:hypothetical protein